MERKDIIDQLSVLERSLPVYDWKFGDAQIWPQIKGRIFFTAAREKMDGFNYYPNSQGNILQRVFRAYREHKLLSSKLSTTKTLIGSAPIFRSTFNDQLVNKFYYPLFGEKKDVLYLENGVYQDSKTRPPQTIELKSLFDYQKLTSKNQLKTSLPGFNEAVQLVPNLRDAILKTEKLIPELANRFGLFTQLYTKLLDQSSINKIYTLCYYSPPMLALHYVANKLSIENIEMQHGGIGELHAFYHFDNFPPEGLNTLPQSIYLWDEATKLQFETWLPADQNPKIEVFGNPWLDFISNQPLEIDEKRKIILYTLQFDQIDPYIFDAVSQTSDDYVWWFRLHPRMKKEEQIIQEQINNRNLEARIFIKDATSLPLPLVLKNCHTHISKFSGSVIEAEYFQKKSIILEPIGCDMYKEYIDKGHSVGLREPTGESIWREINKNQE